MSENGHIYQVAAQMQDKARRLEKTLEALSYIVGFDVSVIADALELCDRYHVDFEQATENYEFRQNFPRPLDEYRCLMSNIGEFVMDVANRSFCHATGIEDFFKINGSDPRGFWTACDDSHEACLRELVVTKPDFVLKLNSTARSLVEEMCEACEIELPQLQKQSRGR